MKTFLMENNADSIRFLGRTLIPADKKEIFFDYSGTGMEFRYIGRVLTCHFNAVAGDEPSSVFAPKSIPKWKVWPRVAVYLDGSDEPHRIITVDRPDKDEIIFSSCEKEDHVIRIVKLTEIVKSGLSADSFFGDGTILPVKTAKKPVIEFVGDSITCGFGILARPETTWFYGEHEDFTKTYAYLTAKALGMEAQAVSCSGFCVKMKDWNGRLYGIAEMYPYTDIWRQEMNGESPELWDFKHHHADIVVINLGSNDAGGVAISKDPKKAEDAFEEDYYNLIADIRARNGLYTKIVCVLGDMQYYLYDRIAAAAKRFIADTGDTKVYVKKLMPGDNFDVRGAANHPGVMAGERMAKELTAFIRTL